MRLLASGLPLLPLRFGLKPFERRSAVLSVTDGDLVNDQLIGCVVAAPAFLKRLAQTYQNTGGLVVVENKAPLLQISQAFRGFALSLADFWQTHRAGQESAKPVDVKVVYDPNRYSRENLSVENGHFDPPYYQDVMLVDGPYSGACAGQMNRFIADAEEVRKANLGKLPKNFGHWGRYMNGKEKRRWGLEFDSAPGSIVLHNTHRWLHWIGQTKFRTSETKTPYGFFGFRPANAFPRLSSPAVSQTPEGADFLAGKAINDGTVK